MDYALVRTFLDVAATGSFVRAAARLQVTQSAVSLRIRRLEESLGRPLFTRSKAGAEMTAAGREFERYALSMIRVWEEARQQVAIPEGFSERLTIGAESSLWPRLGFRWIDALRAARPTLSIRAELGGPDRLTRFLIEGMADAALTYTPQQRPGLTVIKAMNDELVMVASWAGASREDGLLGERYVFVDWGPEFLQAHAVGLPELTNPGLTLSLGTLAAEFIMNRAFAGYLPARYVKRFIDEGALHLVAGTPTFRFPIWAVFRQEIPDDLMRVAAHTLVSAGEALESEQAPLMAVCQM
ncbi:LysR family transcriptional regulator [Silicimonas algicola]|uniref:DNA-binding transcriptional LysR family regulator n=1 Tax=Silicimonas algicola TaxID=1826607 RepID=A0A316G720_9RHOB|nr:LysR family transcriptional regulator [Silicimonas algicola]AZQ69359.1 LysR family transcriptional regulator [Silicimonas algicola]PWK56422.1 DNA-binding transcriptional LysR family regulator [Silicimonas algicola]